MPVERIIKYFAASGLSLIHILVIRISNADVEDNPSVEFQKIFLYVAATLEYEINNICLLYTSAAAAGSMLGNEYRMTSHRCLLAVIGNHRSEEHTSEFQ